MAHLYRLMVAALLFAVCNAQAFTLQNTFTWSFGSDSGQAADFDSACQAGVNQVKSNHQNCTYYGQPCTWETVSQPEAGTCYARRNGNTVYTVGISASNGCPPNSTQSGTSCTCNAGFNERRTGGITQCVKPDDRTPEQLCHDLAMFWNSTFNGDRFGRVQATLSEAADGMLVCYEHSEGVGLPQGKGCKHKFTGDLGFKDDQGNDWVNGHSFAYDDSDKAQVGGSLVCNLSDPEPPKEEQPEKCRDGYLGTVNGVEVCVEAVTGETEGNDWTRNTDGEGNHTDEKTNVKCNGDQCTLTTEKTTTKTDGTTTTTTTTTGNVNRQGYCARNPESSVCGREEDKDGANKGARERGGGSGNGDGEGEENSSKFGGACAAGFTCEGDAILCAIAKDQHKRACDLFDDKTSAEYLLYQSEKEKTGKVTDDLEGNRTVDVAGIVSASDIFLGGAGSCPADPTITLHNGMTFVIPYSTLCPYLVTLGNILVIISSMSAVLILIRRI